MEETAEVKREGKEPKRERKRQGLNEKGERDKTRDECM